MDKLTLWPLDHTDGEDLKSKILSQSLARFEERSNGFVTRLPEFVARMFCFSLPLAPQLDCSSRDTCVFNNVYFDTVHTYSVATKGVVAVETVVS